MVAKPLVLILEDNEDVITYYLASLGGSAAFSSSVELAMARTAEEGWEICRREFHRLAAVILDGMIPGSPDTPEIAHRLIELGFNGPIVANSATRSWQDDLRRSGCNHSANEKHHLPDLVLSLLHLDP